MSYHAQYGDGDLFVRHWMARLQVAALIAMGLWMAGVSIWLALFVGIVSGLLCILTNTWPAISALSGVVAVCGLIVWAMGIRLHCG